MRRGVDPRSVPFQITNHSTQILSLSASEGQRDSTMQSQWRRLRTTIGSWPARIQYRTFATQRLTAEETADALKRLGAASAAIPGSDLTWHKVHYNKPMMMVNDTTKVFTNYPRACTLLCTRRILRGGMPFKRRTTSPTFDKLGRGCPRWRTWPRRCSTIPSGSMSTTWWTSS
jgi:hypothetical protein